VLLYPDCSDFLGVGWRSDNAWLNPGVTHYVFFTPEQRALADRFDTCFRTDALMNVAKITIGCRNSNSWAKKYILDDAQQGCQMVVMDQSTDVACAVCKRVEQRRQQIMKSTERELHNGDRPKLKGVTDAMTGGFMSGGAPPDPPPGAEAGTRAHTPKPSSGRAPIDIDQLDISKEALDNYLLFKCPTVTTDDLVSRLTGKLTRTGGASQEFGHEAAERERLQYAWHLAIVYHVNGARQGRRAWILHVLLLILSLATTSAGCYVAYFYGATYSESDLSDQDIVMITGFTALPLLTALFLSIRTMAQPVVKQAALKSAFSEVTGEIYKYRARVGEYVQSERGRMDSIALGVASSTDEAPDVTFNRSDGDLAESQKRRKGVKPAAKDDSEAPKKNEGPPKKPQEVFKDILTRIHNSVLTKALVDSSVDPYKKDDVAMIEACLYKKPKTKGDKKTGNQKRRGCLPNWCAHWCFCCRCCRGDQGGFLLNNSEVQSKFSVSESDDDGIRSFAGDDYVLFRLNPHINKFHRKARLYSCMLQFTRSLNFLLVAVTGIMSLTKTHIWVPVTVAFGAALESTLEFKRVEMQVRKTDVALAALQEQLMWWQSLSMVQRRFHLNLQSLVESVEQILIDEHVDFMKSGEGKKNAGEDPEDDGDDDDDKKKEKSS
jgi:hypothetical protein